jgi:hypothetical protein
MNFPRNGSRTSETFLLQFKIYQVQVRMPNSRPITIQRKNSIMLDRDEEYLNKIKRPLIQKEDNVEPKDSESDVVCQKVIVVEKTNCRSFWSRWFW